MMTKTREVTWIGGPKDGDTEDFPADREFKDIGNNTRVPIIKKSNGRYYFDYYKKEQQ